MTKNNVFYKIYRFYVDGFKSMTIGKTLWSIILIKLFLMFAILKIFFFPDFLDGIGSDAQKSEYVRNEFINNR